MKFVSLIVSIMMTVLSVLVPTGASYQKTEYSAAKKEIDAFFETFSQNKTAAINEDTYRIFADIIKNVLAEAIDSAGDADEVKALLEQIPVYDTPERPDAEFADVTVNVLKEAFGEVLAKSIEESYLPYIARHFLSMAARGVYGLYVYLVPIEGQENVYGFYADYVNNKNEAVVVYAEVNYDKNTGEIYGIHDNGMFEIGFDYDVDDFAVTSPIYSWQRVFGYNIFYDIFGEMFFMDTNTVRIKFEHGGKQWMFQLWKGVYSFKLCNGAEIGIYNKTNKYALGYDTASDEEMLNMSMVLTRGDEVILDLSERRHWWICGFDFGNPIPPEELLLNGTIEFEDKEMMNKFIESAKEFEDEMTVTADGMKVNIVWQ